MCGLCGVAGNINSFDLSVFKNLLYLSALRGEDSTGVAIAPFRGEQEGPAKIELIKATTPSWQFLDQRYVDKAIKIGTSMLMGHTRSKTVGEINRENAMPFEFPNLVGTHNGTLGYGAKYRLEGENYSAPTDSYALYKRMSEDGFDKVLELTDSKDAMALVWFDREKDQLHAFRNAERPLYYAIDNTYSTFYWASEAGMLYHILNRNKIDFKKVNALEVDHHFVLDIPKAKEIKFSKPVIKAAKNLYKDTWSSVESRVSRSWRQSEIPFGAMHGTSAGFSGVTQGNVHILGNATARSTVIGPGTLKTKPLLLSNEKIPDYKFRMASVCHRAIKDGGPFYKSDYSGKIFSGDDFTNKMYEGCSHCSDCPEWGEPIKFLRDDSFLCCSCIADARDGKGSKELVETIMNFG